MPKEKKHPEELEAQKRLGQWLRKTRESMIPKVYQKDISQAVGISWKTYSKYERGLAMPEWSILERIALFFGKEPEYLREKLLKKSISYTEEIFGQSEIAREAYHRFDDLPDDLQEDYLTLLGPVTPGEIQRIKKLAEEIRDRKQGRRRNGQSDVL